MADILNRFSLVFFLLAIVFFVLTIIVFVVFKIPDLIGDLNGRNARKTIELMRHNNEINHKKALDLSYRIIENEDNETCELLDTEETQSLIKEDNNEGLEMIDSLMLIHTKERI